MLQQWNGVIAIEGQETRDGRIVDQFTWLPQNLPMNFACQFAKADGHEGADVTSARVNTIARVGNQIIASGDYLDTPSGNLAAYLLQTGALSAVSIDGGESDWYLEILDPNGNPVSEQQYLDMPPDVAATCRVRRHFTQMEIAGLTQVDVSAFAGARIALVDSAPETVNDPGQDTTDVGDTQDAAVHRLVASVGASVGHNPEWFRKLTLPGPTRFTITADRRIFGHIAIKGQCHRGFGGRCLNLDFSDDLKDFHNGTALLDTGDIISAQNITFAALHAPDGNFTYDEVQHLIENTGAQFGVVRAYMDEYGLQVCGVAFSDVTEAELDRVRAGTPSYDARMKSGRLRLFGVHVVNTGGSPVYDDADEDGVILRQVASAAIDLPAPGADLELAVDPDSELDGVSPPCGCDEVLALGDLTVPELADVPLALAISDQAMRDIDADLVLEDALAGID